MIRCILYIKDNSYGGPNLILVDEINDDNFI